MSELCLSITPKIKTSNLLISCFTILFSLLISHPLYFLCLILSFPYILRLISFLSPLFITTSLLLIAFLTIFLQKFKPKSDDGDVGGFHSMEALEVYKSVFDTSMIDETRNHFDGFEENPEERILQAVESSVVKIPARDDQDGRLLRIHEDFSVNCEEREVVMKVMQGKRIEDFLKERDEVDESSEFCYAKEENVEIPCKIFDKLVDQQEKESSLLMNGSEENSSVQMKITREEPRGEKVCQPCATDTFEHRDLPSSIPSTTNSYVTRTWVTDTSKYKALPSSATDKHVSRTIEADMFGSTERRISAHSQRLSSETNGYSTDNGEEYTSKDESSRSMEYDMGRYGSMRKEKEWKRTLACKLFEERHNNNVDNGGEGMDLLWETYEMELTKTPNAKTDVIKKKDFKSKGKIEHHHRHHHHYLDEEDEEDDEILEGQICCLQALKFSAGKMNMGVGRRNLVKFSKAVKGFGWLHHVRKPHLKKVHNGDTF